MKTLYENIHGQLPMTLETFREKISGGNVSWRISKSDGKSFVLTRDYKKDRFNLEMIKGNIVNITQG